MVSICARRAGSWRLPIGLWFAPAARSHGRAGFADKLLHVPAHPQPALRGQVDQMGVESAHGFDPQLHTEPAAMFDKRTKVARGAVQFVIRWTPATRVSGTTVDPRGSGQLPDAIEPARQGWGNAIGQCNNAAVAGDVAGQRSPGTDVKGVPAFDDIELVRHR